MSSIEFAAAAAAFLYQQQHYAKPAYYARMSPQPSGSSYPQFPCKNPAGGIRQGAAYK